jgi:hypothetical protein
VPLAGAFVVILEVTLDDGTVHGYTAPLRAGSTIVDALDDPAFGRALLELVARGTARGRRARHASRRGCRLRLARPAT